MKNDDRAYPSSQITTLQSASVIDTPMNERALPRWPFRLALFATTVLIAGSGALLFGIAALKRESLWHVTPWQGEIVGTILCTTAALAIAALGTGVGSLLQNPDTRTPWSYVCLFLAGLSLTVVTVIGRYWTIVMSALLIFSYDGGLAAFGANPPTTGIVGTITSPNGLVKTLAFIDNSGNLRIAHTTKSDGCFAVSGPTAIDFGTYAPGYQDLKVPVGKGYFLVTVNLSPLGAPEPSKVAWRRASALQFINGRNACAEIHH